MLAVMLQAVGNRHTELYGGMYSVHYSWASVPLFACVNTEFSCGVNDTETVFSFYFTPFYTLIFVFYIPLIKGH